MKELVLIPGLNNTRAVFDRVIPALPATVRAHAPDCPPLNRVEAIAEALAPALPERFWLVGFSFGGYVAMALLDALPQRVEGIALVCTTPRQDLPERKAARERSMATVRAGGYLAMVEASAPNTMAPDALRDPVLAAQRRGMVQAYGAERYLAHSEAALHRPDRLHLLRADLPTLLVGATEDRVFPLALARQCAQDLPHARLEVIEGSGHLVPMERPEALAGALAHWMGLPPR